MSKIYFRALNATSFVQEEWLRTQKYLEASMYLAVHNALKSQGFLLNPVALMS